MRHRPHNRLPHLLRRSIYALTGVLVLSGLAWLGVVYLLAAPGEDTPAPHPLAGPLLAAHGMAAYAALAACALVGHGHIRTGWRLTLLRSAGLCLCLTLLGLVLTGLGFYYVANEAAIPWLRWTHVAGGIALPCVLALHIVRGRQATGRA
jgi:hypothetical protein